MNDVIALIGRSFVNPREVARIVLALPRSRELAFSGLALSITLSVLVTFAMSAGAPVPVLPGVPPFGPLLMALMIFSVTIILAFAIHLTGTVMRGQGDLPGAVVVMAWIQALFLAGQILQGVLFLFSPGLSAMAGFAVLLLVIWALLTFVDELQGFGSLGRAAVLLFMAFLGMSLGLSLILSLIGVSA